jgi:hypothetical protein
MQLWVIKRILSDEKRDGEAIRFMANIGWPHVFFVILQMTTLVVDALLKSLCVVK